VTVYVVPVTPLAATVVGGDEVPSSTTYELTVQLAGGVGAVQLRLTELDVVAVTASAVGAGVTAVQEVEAEVLPLTIEEAAEVPSASTAATVK
jgi:hypothetical protein